MIVDERNQLIMFSISVPILVSLLIWISKLFPLVNTTSQVTIWAVGFALIVFCLGGALTAIGILIHYLWG